MKILLDENFPLALVRRLRDAGQEVEHIILLGLRGISDAAIANRLNEEALLFHTHDQEFAALPITRSIIIISRVTQSLPLNLRIEAWLKGISAFFAQSSNERSFTIGDDGKLSPL